VTPGDLRQTVCAFANSVLEGRAAVLFIGVRHKTDEIIGVGNTDQM
jgi:predicted HTH transcriptional regulator